MFSRDKVKGNIDILGKQNAHAHAYAYSHVASEKQAQSSLLRVSGKRNTPWGQIKSALCYQLSSHLIVIYISRNAILN